MKNRQILQMKYHPAKKEVEFRRFQNDQEIAIRDDSRLTIYMKQKGQFVLQDYGNEFFEDIGQAFDGLKVVEVQVITTKTDYEDFVRMVEYYNEEPKGRCKIEPTLLAELPDMGIAFEQVKKHGEDSIRALERYRPRLVEVPQKNESVRGSVDKFRTQLNEAISDIREKINSLGDNRVSLCFTGVYSAGKSALINALLGYRILPESIESKTAKMFRIFGPKEGENKKIIFDILKIPSELEWNPQTVSFEFSKGPSESSIRTDIQQVLNHYKGKQVHEQISEILSYLNGCSDVSSQIDVCFPVALDNEKVQFMIYDTPGTDSNYQEHQDVLLDALNEQTQSILIFVAKPDGLEGTGNNTLLEYLQTAEKSSTKTSIDISRSLFVINKAETLAADARCILQKQEIKSKETNGINIQLANKKLFFTSALYGYISRAIRNGVATDSEKARAVGGKYILALEENPSGHCYRQDRSATSEFATKELIKRCEEALQEAQSENDEMKVLEICSGLYALESEILQYGEKYASAVKAYAIISSVETVLNTFNYRTKALSDTNENAIKAYNKDIQELENTIRRAIEEESKKTKIGDKDRIPAPILMQLEIDSPSLNNFIGDASKKIEGVLTYNLFGNKVKVNRNDKNDIRNAVLKIIEDFKADFLTNRKKILERQRDQFISSVKNIIRCNGNISDSAKQFVENIPAPQISTPVFPDFGAKYELYCKTKKVLLFFDSEYFDKDGFINDVRTSFMNLAGEMVDVFRKDFQDAFNKVIEAVQDRFKNNLDEFSLNVKALKEDRDAMLKLGQIISDAATSLSDSQDRLNRDIWKEVESTNA